jgi:peptidyl-prolyl cis-trans isomerase D
MAVRPGHTDSIEQVRPQIEADLKKQLAGRKFAELAESFNNTVFEQSDSLKPAAQLIHATPRQSGWITRNHADEPLLNDPRVLQAIFSDDVLNNKRNTEAVEAKPSNLVAARLIEHKPATLKPFDEVSPGIVKQLTMQRASQLAAQEGRQELEKLRQGTPVQLSWGAPQLVRRADAKALPEPVLKQVFKVDTSKLPAYSGVEATQGAYTLIRVSKVVEPEKIDPEKQKGLAESLQQAVSQEEMAAYLASLKQKADVKVKQDLLEKK